MTPFILVNYKGISDVSDIGVTELDRWHPVIIALPNIANRYWSVMVESLLHWYYIYNEN